MFDSMNSIDCKAHYEGFDLLLGWDPKSGHRYRLWYYGELIERDSDHPTRHSAQAAAVEALRQELRLHSIVPPDDLDQRLQ